MTSGDMLREKRESLGLTLEAAEDATKIRRKYLEALEHEDYQELPGRVYAKAFLRTYAKYLGLDTDVLLSEFEVRYPSAPDVESRPPTVSTPRKRPAYLRVLLVVAVIAGLFAFNALYGGNDSDTTDPAPPPVSDREDPGEPADPEAVGGDDPVVVDPVPEEGVPDELSLMLVVAESPSWVRVSVDGVQEFEGNVSPGETLEFTGQESVAFRVGNAGAVELHLNGENMGLVGDYGAVAEREFTIEEFE